MRKLAQTSSHKLNLDFSLKPDNKFKPIAALSKFYRGNKCKS